MKYNAVYNAHAENEALRIEAQKRARAFIDKETQFHLGGLPTEQPHAYTMDFSASVQRDPEEGVRMLLSVDQDLPPVARRVFLSPEYNALVDAFLRVIDEGRRVCFSGCGSTGRLSIMLEEMWRAYWEGRAGVGPGEAEARGGDPGDELKLARNGCSIMTGGDRALISSVEGFEDHEQFGARQVADLELQEGDLLIAISEGGETSSVIGTALEGRRRGCQVFFVYNNPTAILIRDIERSRRLITHDGVTAIDLFSGQMALSGSTRMQATSLEMLVVGAAMEEALLRSQSGEIRNRLETADHFARLLVSFQESDNRRVLGSIALAEAELYTRGGRVTYFADQFLLDIICDTTERTPTFMLPPFRPVDDTVSPVSWAYAKNPRFSSSATWCRMLRRKPRGIYWSAADYKAMDAPSSLVASPPALDDRKIATYHIGSEDDPSRYRESPHLYISFLVGDDVPEIPGGCAADNHRYLVISPNGCTAPNMPANAWSVKLFLPESPIKLWHHLGAKLLFNTISTASMGIMGRIRKNWMVQVDCTNKKLIDRGSRIISEISGLSYEDGCFELHLSLLAKAEAKRLGNSSTISPVIASLERLEMKLAEAGSDTISI
jgi:N-acetylmuramic acid 6-phosphate etherase